MLVCIYTLLFIACIVLLSCSWLKLKISEANDKSVKRLPAGNPNGIIGGH